jgi:serine/threonine-protein kinase
MENRPASILFVDDDPRIVNLLRMLFRGTYQVHTATSGRQALEIAAAHPIDVIVSDQRMPGMLGIELLAEMGRRHPATMRVLLTGYSDLNAIIGSVNEGEVFRFINKPWDHDEIKRIVAEAANAARVTARVPALTSPPPAEPVPPPGHADAPGVLVIDDSDADRLAIMEALGRDFGVHGAVDISSALKILEAHDIGVIVAEARIRGQEIGDLLNVLKHHHPMVTAVMLSRSADSEHIIRLINGAQIFRFGVKPIRGNAFRLAVSAAMREHLRLRANPMLVARHKVDAPAGPENESLMVRVVTSLLRLRVRFGRPRAEIHG